MTDQIDKTPEFLTVRELAELLRIKERKVYDLVASGDVPVSRVTGKLLFPEREVRAWIAGASSGGEAAPAERPPLLLGSHDPLLEWAVRQSRCGLALFQDGSHDGLTRFAAREGVAAGLHICDEAGDWNISAVEKACGSDNVVLVSWAIRQRGLVIRPNAAGDIRTVPDLVGRRVAPRQRESGTHVLFERLLQDAGVSPADIIFTETAPSENDAVLAVAQGTADAVFGLQALAQQYGLGFVPLIEERFDLLIDRRAWFEPPLQRLMDFCRNPSFARHAAEMAGYDVSVLGDVRWNA